MDNIIPFPKSTHAATDTSPDTGQMSNEVAPKPSEEELQEVLDIFKQARRGLTDDSLTAVMVLRQEIGLHQALVDLLLDGKIEAEVIGGGHKTLTSANLRFRAWPADEDSSQPSKLNETGV